MRMVFPLISEHLTLRGTPFLIMEIPSSHHDQQLWEILSSTNVSILGHLPVSVRGASSVIIGNPDA